MTASRTLLVAGLALFLSVTASGLFAQAGGSDKPQCFAIRVRLNGKPVDGPQVITFRTKTGDNTASVEGNCFKVPSGVLKDEVVDVSFTIPKNKVYLSAISTGFLAGPWDVDLQDKRFARDVVVPRNARTRETCAVVFHVGEPERGLVQTGCRTPLKRR